MGCSAAWQVKGTEKRRYEIYKTEKGAERKLLMIYSWSPGTRDRMNIKCSNTL